MITAERVVTYRALEGNFRGQRGIRRRVSSPEALIEGRGSVVGLVTTAGFLVAFVLSRLE